MRFTRSRRTWIAVVVAALVGGSTLAGELTANGTQPDLEYPLRSPATCSFCHSDLVETAEATAPWSAWAGTMMANSSRDPLFWAAVDVANKDIPGVGDWCMRCHVPHGWLAGRSEAPGGTTDGCSLQGAIDLPGSDFDGVSCHLCHRMQVNENPPDGQQPLYLENAEWWIDDERCGDRNEPCRAGPYDYSDGTTAPPPHSWKYSELHRTSELCAHCHTVTHPVNTLKIDGRDTEVPFPIERTFREWQRSAYGDPESARFTSCSGCHMPQASAEPAFACIFGINDRSGDLARHEFVGGNSWVPEVLAGEYPQLGLNAQLMQTAANARARLQERTAKVKLGVGRPTRAGDPLDVRVHVTNLTGHKLPTGYHEGRRMWLHVKAVDADGATVFESGAYDPLTGVLERDDQIKVYEARYGTTNPDTGKCEVEDENGREQFNFVLNDCIDLDNRIPPLGFDAKPDIETRHVAYEYPRTADGKSRVNYDITDYRVDVPANAARPIVVTATLRYQTTSKEYVEFLYEQSVENDFPDDCIQRSTGPLGMSRGEYLKEVWERYDKSPPVDVDSATLRVSEDAAEPAPRGDGQLLVDAYDPATRRLDLRFQPVEGAANHVLHFGRLQRVDQLTIDRSDCQVGVDGVATAVAGNASEFFLLGAALDGTFGLGAGGLERQLADQASCSPTAAPARRMSLVRASQR